MLNLNSLNKGNLDLILNYVCTCESTCTRISVYSRELCTSLRKMEKVILQGKSVYIRTRFFKLKIEYSKFSSSGNKMKYR